MSDQEGGPKPPDPVFVQKLRILAGRGFRSCGVLLTGQDEIFQFVGLTEHGKVLWWQGNPPQPGSIIERIDEFAGRAWHDPVEGLELLEEAKAEIHNLERSLRIMSEMVDAALRRGREGGEP